VTADSLYKSNPNSAKDRGIVTALLNKLAYTEGALGNRAGSLQHFNGRWKLTKPLWLAIPTTKARGAA